MADNRSNTRTNLRLTVSLSGMALAGMAGPAWAQSQAEATSLAEASSSASANDTGVSAAEIIVTGFRASLRNSLDEKRTENVQVDAINAEDIADFPDSNLAESLQRLPGVSIDRDNGEGRQISVRGLGGDFNRTRLNGLEALATAGSNDSGTSPNRSRAFDYNTFASELFSSLKVRKTSAAETDEGSLGATIDLETGKPFDYNKPTLALSSEASYQENSKKFSPRIAGLASTRFADNTMGILISGAYSKSSNEIDQYRRSAGSSDYLYRGSDWAGNESPQRAGFAAPVGTDLGSAITNPDAIAQLTGSDPEAYAKLFPGAPYNTPGRYDDSRVRIPALPSIEQQNVRNQRIGLTAAYQWQMSDRTLLTIDGVYSRFKNTSVYNQIGPVGLNRNNTNAAYNTAGNNLTPTAARNLYPGLCAPAAGDDLTAPMDCGQQLYGTTPAFSTALDANGNLVDAVLGTGAIVPGATSPANANIFSTNPNNLDPYDYYNNPNSVGYIPSSNRLAYRGNLIGRPAVRVMDANVTNGVADYLVLENVDFRSAQDMSTYTTAFKQGSIRLDHEFTDTLKVHGVFGRSESSNDSEGLLVEFNRMNSPGQFVFDERGGGSMPSIDFGFDPADASNWDTVKGFSAIRRYVRKTDNTYTTGKVDAEWAMNSEFTLKAGLAWRKYTFSTVQYERVNDLLNPTLREAGVNVADVAKTIDFGQGLNVPEGSVSSFVVPDIAAFEKLYDFRCNCVNEWGDWRVSNKRNRTTSFGVTEKNLTGYVQADFDTLLFGRAFRGNAGVRVAGTDLTSVGETQAGRPIKGRNRYTDFLPSLNLVYEPVDDFLVRFAAAKVIARPLLGNLSPSISSISVPNTGDTTGGSLTIGNPQLSPFQATNLDFSAEWYFAPGGLMSVALFNKQIASFPQTVLYEAPLSQFADAETIAAIRAQYTNPSQIAYIDGNYPFLARQYRDAPGGYVRGIEVNFQMDLTFLPGLFKNFGILINGTYIKSQLEYILDPGSATAPQTTAKAPFLGVSPKALNATLYYEGKRFRGRVSAAYRAGYSTTYPIASGSCSPGISTSPVPTNPNASVSYCGSPLINDFQSSRSTLNVDASTSFQITERFSISAEALNLTNQPSERYAYSDQPVVTQYSSSGRVFRIGGRVKF